MIFIEAVLAVLLCVLIRKYPAAAILLTGFICYEAICLGLYIFEEILETTAGGAVSCHCGPGTLGILFISRE